MAAVITTESVGGGRLDLLDGIRRQVDYWSVVYQRTWRGSVISSFLAPLFYVVAMGVLLGGFIDADPDVLEGATSYFDFVVPGPLSCRDLVAAHLTFVMFRLATTCGVYTLVLAPFGVYGSWWGPIAAFLSQILVGMTFAVWVYGFSARLHSEEGYGVLFRLGVFPLFLFSGAFFPISNLGTVGEWIARCTPLWHGVNLSRMFALDNVTWWVAAVNVAYLSVLTVGGWFWAVSGLEKRLIS
jgi:lipooligosaccharide transport system permease protein